MTGGEVAMGTRSSSSSDEQVRQDASLQLDRSEAARRVVEADQRLERLTTAYVENVLTLEEHRQAKAKALAEKTAVEEHAKNLEQNPAYWLESTQRLQVRGDETAEKVKLLRKTGSNLQIRDRRISLEFRAPWKTLE